MACHDQGRWEVQIKPSAPKSWLLATAGLMWSGVGVWLCIQAGLWLAPVAALRAALLGAAGIVGSVLVHWFGFSRLARRNLDRLARLPEKPCFFAFQAWRSYILIAVMICLGIVLRHSGLPKPWLAVVYATIGGALFLSSFQYHRRLYRRFAEPREQPGDCDHSDPP